MTLFVQLFAKIKPSPHTCCTMPGLLDILYAYIVDTAEYSVKRAPYIGNDVNENIPNIECGRGKTTCPCRCAPNFPYVRCLYIPHLVCILKKSFSTSALCNKRF